MNKEGTNLSFQPLPPRSEQQFYTDNARFNLNTAKESSTLSGNLCIIMGWICSIVGLLSTIIIFISSDFNYGFLAGGVVISLIFALLGAPIAAVGSQTNDARRQTEIAFIQARLIEIAANDVKSNISPTQQKTNP